MFLEFTSGAKDATSHTTNDKEEEIIAAFDDTDIRLAEASKPKCCFMEQKEHQSLFKYSCGALFIFIPLWVNNYNNFSWKLHS